MNVHFLALGSAKQARLFNVQSYERSNSISFNVTTFTNRINFNSIKFNTIPTSRAHTSVQTRLKELKDLFLVFKNRYQHILWIKNTRHDVKSK